MNTLNSKDGLLHGSYECTVDTPEKQWLFRAMDLANYRGLTTKLDYEIWLDWHDILAEPEKTRMHMYPGADKKVDGATKRVRMETWQTAIGVYDMMMIDVEAPLNAAHIVDLIHQHRLPRPKTVALDTGNESLRRLLDSFNLTITAEKPHPFVADWNEFVSIARRGDLVRKWLHQKGLDS